MKKLLYLLYVILVVAITLVAGRDSDSRYWSSGSSGRSGWSSGGGHK